MFNEYLSDSLYGLGTEGQMAELRGGEGGGNDRNTKKGGYGIEPETEST